MATYADPDFGFACFRRAFSFLGMGSEGKQAGKYCGAERSNDGFVHMRDRVAKWLIFCRLKYSGQRIVSGIFVISIY
jgi:hypothetical protein